MLLNKKILTVLVLVIALLFIVVGSWQMLERQAEDYDEWGYTNVFLLANQGNKLYKDVFLSQPPGFFAVVNPGFMFLGKSIQAARLTVFIWSIIGLLGVIWFAHEIKNIWIGVLAIGFLYLTPHYFKESVTFRSDPLIPVFSILAVASMVRFFNTRIRNYLFLSTFFFFVSFSIKLDFSSILPLLLIFLKSSKGKMSLMTMVNRTKKFILLFAVMGLIFLGMFIYFVDWKACLDNVVLFGIRAMFKYPYTKLPETLSTTYSSGRDWMLIILLCSGLLFSGYTIIKKKTSFVFNVLFTWSMSTLFILIFYKPFMSHQLVFSTIPFSLLISFLLLEGWKKNEYLKPMILVFMLVSTLIFMIKGIRIQKQLVTKDQQLAVSYVYKLTAKDDYIVTDDYSISALSKRKTIPELSDVSWVRIISGDLSAVRFQKELETYKPKLIFVWTGRLIKIRGFEKITKDYQLYRSIGEERKIYVRKT